MTWSFSRLNYSCLHEWVRHYVDCEKQDSNFYAEFGSLVHECIEYYAKGILPDDQILEYYDNNFDDYCKTYFDPEKREQYYQQGYEYVKCISKKLPLDSFEVLGVEEQLTFSLKERRPGFENRDYPFTGFIDLHLKNKKTGEIIIMDNKSASMKFRRDGSVYKNQEDHWKKFQYQLYLYSYPFVEKGEKIDTLAWNFFRQGGLIKPIPWVKEDYEEAVNWALDQIHTLENEKLWFPNEDFFYCNNLCGYRNKCFMPQGEDNYE